MRDTNKFYTAALKNFSSHLPSGLCELSSWQGSSGKGDEKEGTGGAALSCWLSASGCFDEICIKLRLIVTGFGELREILNFMCILMAQRQLRLWLWLQLQLLFGRFPLTRVVVHYT